MNSWIPNALWFVALTLYGGNVGWRNPSKILACRSAFSKRFMVEDCSLKVLDEAHSSTALMRTVQALSLVDLCSAHMLS